MSIGAPAGRFVAALIAFAGLSTSNSQAQAPSELKWQELGARVFEQSCGVCHQPTGLGVPGAWIAAVMDITTRATLMTIRFRRGKWKHIKV